MSHAATSTDARFNNFATGALVANIADNDENQTPSATDDQATTAEDTPVTISVLANDSDPDGDVLQVSGVTQPAGGGSVAITGGGQGVRFTPAAHFSGQRAFTYTISDGHGGTATATVTATVTPVNDDPSTTNDAASTTAPNPVVVSVLANDSDVDGDDLSVSAVTQPANGTAAITGGGQTVTYTPPAGFSGSATFGYTASDGHGGTASSTVTVTVESGEVPVPDIEWTTAEDTPLERAPLATAGNCEIPRILGVTQPANGSVTILNQTLCDAPVQWMVRFVPGPNFTGVASFTFTGTYSTGPVYTGRINVLVTPVNDAPVAADNTGNTTAPNPVTLLVLANDSDVDGDPLTVSAVTQPVSGTAAISGGGQSVTYTPTPTSSGVQQFTYTVSDGHNGTATATVKSRSARHRPTGAR